MHGYFRLDFTFYTHLQVASLYPLPTVFYCYKPCHAHFLVLQAGTASMPPPAVYSMLAMQAEIRTLEFWRSIIAECIATFIYVLLVLNVTSASTQHELLTNSGLAAGLAMATVSFCFSKVCEICIRFDI